MNVNNMELYDAIDGAYFTHEIVNPIDVSEVNMDWLEDEICVYTNL